MCHLGLMCHMEIVQTLCQKGVWEMCTGYCRWAQLFEEHRKLCSLAQTYPLSHKVRGEKNVRGGGGVSNNEAFIQELLVQS